jgi:hypothetical protein
MHRFVLEDAEHGLRTIEERIPGTLELGRLQRFEDAAIGFVRELPHEVTVRPFLAGRVLRRFTRVDTARKEPLEFRIDARPA